MINVEQTDKSIREMLEANEVDEIVQSCNCFHDMSDPVSTILNELTNNKVSQLDRNSSPYGEINKLGDWVGGTYLIAGRDVDIYSLYTRFTTPARVCDTIHWSSAHDGLYDILEQSESGSVVAVQNAGYTEKYQAEFIALLNGLAKTYDNDLPDVDIVVFNH